MRKRFFATLSLISFFVTTYILTLGISYNAGLNIKSNLKAAVSTSDLCSAASVLSKRISDMGDNNTPSTLTEYYSELAEIYPKICHGYGLNSISLPKPKPLLSSRLFSYFGALAFYSYPTAEINVNTEIPEYMMPFTLAHEYAHLSGVLNEGEANFVAYLACEASENPYIRYSAYASALEYILSDIRKNDAEMYRNVYNNLPNSIKLDYKAANSWFLCYSNTAAYRLVDKLNSCHLEIFDSGGQNSYSLVSRYVANHINSA